VRFTATRRTYAYRVLHSVDNEQEGDHESDVYSTACYHLYPFEDDRVWRIHEKSSSHCRKKRISLDIDAMNIAGQYLTGTHDFTSFRGKGCQRSSPIVTIESISCLSNRYHANSGEGMLNAAFRHASNGGRLLGTPETLQLVTIVISGNSFVYHQIRNIVACLVEVGQGKRTPEDVKAILEKKDRSCAVGMAPPQGLFLVDVEHGDFTF
jgi:tRNA pseudouridine38-40 synthase